METLHSWQAQWQDSVQAGVPPCSTPNLQLLTLQRMTAAAGVPPPTALTTGKNTIA